MENGLFSEWHLDKKGISCCWTESVWSILQPSKWNKHNYNIIYTQNITECFASFNTYATLYCKVIWISTARETCSLQYSIPIYRSWMFVAMKATRRIGAQAKHLGMYLEPPKATSKLIPYWLHNECIAKSALVPYISLVSISCLRCWRLMSEMCLSNLWQSVYLCVCYKHRYCLIQWFMKELWEETTIRLVPKVT